MLEELVYDRLHGRSSPGQDSWGSSSTDVLREEMVGKEGYSRRHGGLGDSVRSPENNYGWGRGDNVARILRYGRMSC